MLNQNIKKKHLIAGAIACLAVAGAILFLSGVGGNLLREKVIKLQQVEPLTSSNEIVMNEGMIIKATNDSGTIIIEAKSGLERIYKWGDGEIKVRLIPRKKRWYGSLGVYYPGGDKKIQAVVEEGQQHFCSKKEALEWLNWLGERVHYVYTSDGIVVGWYTGVNPDFAMTGLTVQLWQLCILGKKPHDLPGARNDMILISNSNESPYTCAPMDRFSPSKPQIIAGRLYSGKSLDYMKEMGISPTDVEEAISNGKLTQHGPYTTYTSLDDPFDILWVMIDKNGRVVLVGR